MQNNSFDVVEFIALLPLLSWQQFKGKFQVMIENRLKKFKFYKNVKFCFKKLKCILILIFSVFFPQFLVFKKKKIHLSQLTSSR
jgi:hypothetical protein